MEFKFNVNDIFKQPIVEINNNLIPPGFSGDRRALWDTLGKVSEVVNTMGEASAVAQGLSKPITTAERLRNSEHKLYFLIDQAANNGKGAVTGMLKTGNKGLYVFDRDGQHYQVTPPCILDFYIHESRQRTGLGKHLFEHMLQKEEIEPVKMAIDRPSDKLLGFLNKHYSLNTPVKQMNNYVVFDGFFPKSAEPSHVTESKPSGNLGRKESANGLQKFTSPQGRYGAPRPPCSMGQIIHNQTTNNKNQEPTGVKSLPATNYQGVHHGGSYPVSQSTPNVSVGQRILNNACSQNFDNSNLPNFNQTQNYNSQSVLNPQNIHKVVTSNQAPTGTVQSYQYNTNQLPSTDVALQNQNTSQPQYNNAQHIYNQQALNNDLQQTLYTNNYNAAHYQNITQGNRENLVTAPQAGKQSYMQQPYHNLENAQVPQNFNAHNPVSSQLYLNNPQHQQGIISPPPQYANVNQQFQNLNLNNHLSSTNTAANNTVPSPNTQYVNSKMPPQAYENQTVESNIPNNTLTNTPQTYNNTVRENYMQNVRNNNTSDLMPQYSTNNNLQAPQQVVQNATRPQEVSPPHQNTIEPHLQSNRNVQSNNFAVNQLPQTPQVDNNLSQVHSYPHHNISQSQMLPPHPYGSSSAPHTANMPNRMPPQPVASGQFNQQAAGQQNVPLQQPYGASGQVTYSQEYGNQNLNLAGTKEQFNQSFDNVHSQDPSLVQTARPVYSDRNVSNAQMSRHNLVNESSSAPNMPSCVTQRSVEFVPNAFGDNTQVENRSAASAAGHPQGLEANQNLSQGDMKPVYEEECLTYGYPPQFTNDVQDDVEKPHVSSKLERPQSLSIQKSEEEIGDIALNDKDCKNLEDNVELTDIQNNLKAVKINEDAIAENLPSSEADNAASTKTPSHLTNQGYFDIKFYHNKLW